MCKFSVSLRAIVLLWELRGRLGSHIQAIASRLEAIASRLEAIACSQLEAIARKLEAHCS